MTTHNRRRDHDQQPGRCAAARQLKQDVHSITTKGNNPTAQAGLNLFAKAREAEARANPLSSGLYQ